MNPTHTAFYKSEIGFLRAIGSDDGLHELEFTDLKSAPHSDVPVCFKECFGQLDEYFSGELKNFSLTLNPQGTDFQKSVWRQLVKIPFGQTTSYLHIATALGNKKALRAVGAANGQNRIPIIIPCHRVIGSDGSLIGFGGGIWRKEWLLRHEKVVLV